MHVPQPRARWRTASAISLALALLATVFIQPSYAHESDNDGHVAANTNYGFEVIGRDLLEGITDGKYTDVWSQDGFAYIGTFQEPDCSNAGVFVVDIAAAIENYPNTQGAVVGELKSPPNTRINDVKTHTVGDRTVLITTEEPCGAGIKGGTVSGDAILKDCPPSSDQDDDGVGDCNRGNLNGNKDEFGRRSPGAPTQLGRGGISLWDVSDPTKITPLEKSFLDFRGVHNTFPWTAADGRSYLIGVADTFDFEDVFIVEITDPKKPELVSFTGLNSADWVVDPGEQLFLGQFGFPLLHDVWVENIDGRDMAVLSYWDYGFVNLDVTNPAAPAYMGDTDYRVPDPLSPIAEGNAHAAVYGGNGDYIFGGDEDFDPVQLGVSFDGQSYAAGDSTFSPSEGLTGTAVVVGNTGCAEADVPEASAENQVAVILRGACRFDTKALNAQNQGYVGFVIVNVEDTVISLGGDPALGVTIPGLMVASSVGALIVDGTVFEGSAMTGFNGWGYLHVYNNTGGPLDVPTEVPGASPTQTIDHLGEIGYYAPAETVEPPPDGIGAFDRGDLTMHNIEVDPSTQDIFPTFDQGPRMFVSWYSLGMRALEYRPGHFHDNSNGEGSYSWNVHEVGRFIAEDGSNFWGVHVDEIDGQQIIVASDRNTGLWIFTFDCGGAPGPFYCEGGID